MNIESIYLLLVDRMEAAQIHVVWTSRVEWTVKGWYQGYDDMGNQTIDFHYL